MVLEIQPYQEGHLECCYETEKENEIIITLSSSDRMGISVLCRKFKCFNFFSVTNTI